MLQGCPFSPQAFACALPFQPRHSPSHQRQNFSFLSKDIYLLNLWVIPEAYYDWPTDMSPLKGSQKEQKETTMEVLAYQAHLCGDKQNFWSEMNIGGHLS